MNPIVPERRITVAAGCVAALFAVGSCGGDIIEPDDPEPNVIVHLGAEVTTTDDAVLVDGAPQVHFSSSARGMFTQHSLTYENGGPFPPANDHMFQESWYMDVGRRVVTGLSADTVFMHYVDFGDVALEGTPSNHFAIDTVRVFDWGDGEVRVYDNFILKRISFFGDRLKADGSHVTFSHGPAYDLFLDSGTATLTATGSDELEPFSADFSLRPSARITDLSSGGTLAFVGPQPLVSVGRPLVIDFDRPLDRETTVIRITYLDTPPADQELQRRASAAFTLVGRTNRIVIPPSALRAIAAEVPDVDGPFMLRVSEHLQIEDLYSIERPGAGTESLSGYQSNSITVYFRMR